MTRKYIKSKSNRRTRRCKTRRRCRKNVRSRRYLTRGGWGGKIPLIADMPELVMSGGWGGIPTMQP